MEQKSNSIYSETWDKYVEDIFPRIQSSKPHSQTELKQWQVLNRLDDQYHWPGDEWGDDNTVSDILETCLFNNLSEEPDVVCEIGSGAGRFSQQFLAHYPSSRLLLFDVSKLFLDKLQERLAQSFQSDRFETFLLDSDPRFISRTIADQNLCNKIDAMYSFDAMVHVELHTIVIYIATASVVLKPGGILTMNVADATSTHGFRKLLFNSPGVYQRGGAAGMQFQFLSRDIIETLLGKFGFEFSWHNCNDRDLFFTAVLREPGAARAEFAGSESNWWLTK